MTPRDIEVELPSEESFVRMARLVVSGFATSSTRLDDARLGALRLAVAETYRAVLERRGTGDVTPLRLRARVDGDRLHVWIEDPSGEIGGDRLVVAELLVTELGVEQVESGGTAVHLVMDQAAQLAPPLPPVAPA